MFVNEHYLKLPGGYLFPEIGRRIDAYVAGHPQARSRLIHCGIGDVTEPLPAAAIEAIKKAADELARHETFRGYGPATGYDFLREAIARVDYAARGLDVDPSEVFVSDGAKGDCGNILEIFGPGNRVAVADPVYPVYVDTNVMAGNTGACRRDGSFDGVLYLAGTPDNGFVPPPPDDAVDLVYLCFPNNPTGAVATHEQLEAWVGYALKHDALILFDAAYEAFVGRDDLPRSIYEIEGARCCAIEFKSFSKSGGFTGVRCGYTICPRDVEGMTRAGENVGLHKLWTRRWSTRSNGVSYPVQRAAEALYSPPGRAQVAELIGRYRANAAALRDGCEAVGLKVWGGENAPYVWVACPEGVSSWDMFDRLLQQANVVVVPGAGFGACGEGFFRISAFNTAANVQEAMRRFREHADELFAPSPGAAVRS